MIRSSWRIALTDSHYSLSSELHHERIPFCGGVVYLESFRIRDRDSYHSSTELSRPIGGIPDLGLRESDFLVVFCAPVDGVDDPLDCKPFVDRVACVFAFAIEHVEEVLPFGCIWVAFCVTEGFA